MRQVIRYSVLEECWMWYEVQTISTIGEPDQEVIVNSLRLEEAFDKNNPQFKSKIEDFVYLVAGLDNVLDSIAPEDIVSHYKSKELLEQMDRKEILNYIKEDYKDE
jgi:hypothetical protein